MVVTSAGVQDRDGAVELFADRFLGFRRLMVIWADAACSGLFVGWIKGLRPIDGHLLMLRAKHGSRPIPLLKGELPGFRDPAAPL